MKYNQNIQTFNKFIQRERERAFHKRFKCFQTELDAIEIEGEKENNQRVGTRVTALCPLTEPVPFRSFVDRL